MRMLVVLSMLAACNAPPGAAVASYTPGGRCPNKALELPESGTCTCPADAADGTVWGTGQYSSDSAVCAAARHAGALRAGEGGTVTFATGPGCARYVGSYRNGVSSRSYGSWYQSVRFSDTAAPGCDQQLGGGAAPPAARVSRPMPSLAPSDLQPCPDVMEAPRDGKLAAALVCSCAAARIAAGPVWGSNPYTLDSNLCAAALHAGALGRDGGALQAELVPGCAAYPGSVAHDIATRASDGTPLALRFGDATCPPVPGVPAEAPSPAGPAPDAGR